MKETIGAFGAIILLSITITLIGAGILGLFAGANYLVNWGNDRQQERYFKCLEKREPIECGKMFYKYELDLDKQ